MTRHDTTDLLAAVAVIAAMVLFFATAGALVEWWDRTAFVVVVAVGGLSHDIGHG